MRVGDGREKLKREREYLRERDSRRCKRDWERERVQNGREEVRKSRGGRESIGWEIEEV